MPSKPIFVWFRSDLRLADHRALTAALAEGVPVIPVYVHDPGAAGQWTAGGASRWWLHGSLVSLARSLADVGAGLVLRSGATADVLAALADETGATGLYFTRAYEPWSRALEERVRTRLAAAGVEVKRFAGALLHEPEDVRTKAGAPFQVYTPFWRAVIARGAPARPLDAPSRIPMPRRRIASERLDDWRLRPTSPDWAGGLRACWQPGEAGACAQLAHFLDHGLAGYAGQRNRPDLDGTSRLSPHLHFGEISPRACWHRVSAAAKDAGRDADIETFLKELVWREFSAHVLIHWPTLADEPLRPEFARFPWRTNKADLSAWQQGRTGYPLVDAGMRELRRTGFMHNRVRMVAASFLIKHLLIPWQTGERWFWDNLVDADLATNAANWQWVAGSGMDAAPYFRIFNPVSQGETFDPAATYVRRWVPEIAKLPDEVIHAPWTASAAVLARAGVRLGETYPQPIVDHAAARLRALGGYAAIRA